MNSKSFKKSLVFVALLLALLAMIAGNPTNKEDYPDWNFKSSKINLYNISEISVTELSRWIMSKRNDFIIIDSRLKKENVKYQIPFSYDRQIIIDSSFNKIDSFVIYSQDGALPEEFWDSLYNKKDKNLYLLHGGLDEWIKIILFPDISKINFLNNEQIEKAIASSRYFGGKPKLTQKLGSQKSKKYLREGC